MGAWGMDVFEDDTSCDLLYDAMETDAKSFIAKAITHRDSEYLEYDDCHEVIVSGVILDAIINKNSYKHETDGFDDWLAAQKVESIQEYKDDVLSSLKSVLSDKSELNELWAENEEDYPVWKKNIESIISKLSI